MKEKALKLDSEDVLKRFRSRFKLPKDKIYLCSHSLGLPPLAAFENIEQEMEKWSTFGAAGWFEGWYTSEMKMRKSLGHLLGAYEEEVTVMNSLTINLHLLLTSFYQPTSHRFKILTDGPSFPSDLYALKSHSTEIIQGDSEEELETILLKEGDTIALVFINGVNFLTGKLFDIKKMAAIAKSRGCFFGCDLAHSAGNIPLNLHEWDVDFAVGCSYKYLCSGPGSPGIAFVHKKHHNQPHSRLSGWWGNDPGKRFQMHLQPDFIPFGGASSWQVSTPSILGQAPLEASLSIFEEAGIGNIREKSKKQTAFLLELCPQLSLITPLDPHHRGAMLSLPTPRLRNASNN